MSGPVSYAGAEAAGADAGFGLGAPSAGLEAFFVRSRTVAAMATQECTHQRHIPIRQTLARVCAGVRARSRNIRPPGGEEGGGGAVIIANIYDHHERLRCHPDVGSVEVYMSRRDDKKTGSSLPIDR